MKKIVIDTNVLISAILKGRVTRLVIQFIVDSPNYQWFVSAEIVAEYKEVLSRKKFKLPDEIKNQWLAIIDLATTLIDVNIEIDFPRDRKDAKFLECAVAAKADFLITGDADFTEAQNLIDTPIVSVSLFKKLVCDVENKQEVKEIAQELLATLKREKLVIDWKKRQQTRASVEVAIKDMLDRLPQSYSDELYERKCNEVYQHIYDSYTG